MITRYRRQLWILAVTILTATALLAHSLRERIAMDSENRPRQDGGYSTEAVIVTALLAAAALTVIGIIIAKVLAKANAITL